MNYDNYINKVINNSNIQPRDYQIRIINKTLDHFLNKGTKSVLIEAPCGCHVKGQKILMYDGTLKEVENISINDKLMGPDSTPRTVLEICRGQDQMYKIIPIKGEPFIVNENHILTLYRLKDKSKAGGKLHDISVKDYIRFTPYLKTVHKLIRSDEIAFEQQVTDLPIEPYTLGILLGNGGFKGCTNITISNYEMLPDIINLTNTLNLKIREESGRNCTTYYFSKDNYEHKSEKNNLVKILINLNLYNTASDTKFIPNIYKTIPANLRLELLAGLLDTDGYLYGNNYYEYSTKSKQLAEDFLFLCRSLGFAAYSSYKYKKCQNGNGDYYYIIHLSGNTDRIPCKVEYKKAKPRKQIKSVLVTGFTVEKLDIQDYYGFILDKDHRYLLDDFTITHNSGKTIIALLIIKILQEFFQQNPDKKNFIHFSSTTEPPSSETTKICEANFRCGWVSMRKNLLTQVLQENINKGINADITTISMFEKNPPQVDFLCIDESQHDSVASMAHIYNVCQPKHILGITATPFRSDRVKLCFSTIIKDAGIGKLIHDGYLSPYEHYTIPKWSPETVCEFYLKDINRWGKSLFYFRHIKECYAAKEIFNRWGIDAEVVTSKTDKDRQIQDFIENKYNILINCNILTEGFNSPDLQSVWCRPAHTKGTVIQMCGRAFRIHPDIPHKNIIQCKKTKWPFIKTATPLNQFIWVDDEWRSLKPNPSIMVAQRAVVNAIRMIDVEMPKHIEKYKEKRAKIRRGSPRNRPLTSTI